MKANDSMHVASESNDVPTENYEARKEKYRKEIGNRIREARKKLGFTQEQMVSYLPTGRANYSRIEKGEVFPNPIVLQLFYTQFNISLEWLLCKEGTMFRQKELENVMRMNDSTPEIRDLLVHLEQVPMVKHAVLRFFLEYKSLNKRYIQSWLHPEYDMDDEDGNDTGD